MQLLIIDALNLIRRLHAVQVRHQPDEAGALAATGSALTHATRRLLGQFKPSHVVAVFDGAPVGFRHRLCPEYKAGRKPMSEALSRYLGELQQLLWQQGIDALLSDTDEADDLIATLAGTLARHGKPSIIVSTDQGFCQLLGPHIRIWDHFNQRWLDEAFVQQQYGLEVTQLVDYRALTGVSGSQIKGVPGIGPKRARALLQQHDTLDSLLAVRPESKDENTVHDHRHHAMLSRQLVKLVDDIALGFNLQDLRYRPSAKGS